MKQFIHITKENREGLAKIFKVGERTVWNALQFAEVGDADMSKRIRKAAIERGGILMAKEVPMEQTFWDHDDYMRQYYMNGAVLELNRKDNSAVVFFKGEAVRNYTNVLLSDIEGMQYYAMALR